MLVLYFDVYQKMALYIVVHLGNFHSSKKIYKLKSKAKKMIMYNFRVYWFNNVFLCYLAKKIMLITKSSEVKKYVEIVLQKPGKITITFIHLSIYFVVFLVVKRLKFSQFFLGKLPHMYYIICL